MSYLPRCETLPKKIAQYTDFDPAEERSLIEFFGKDYVAYRKSKKTEADVSDAKARYLARKAAKEKEKA